MDYSCAFSIVLTLFYCLLLISSKISLINLQGLGHILLIKHSWCNILFRIGTFIEYKSKVYLLLNFYPKLYKNNSKTFFFEFQHISTTTVSILSKHLPRLLSDPDFGPIMMPTSKLRQLHLPIKQAIQENHNPFPL